jgi:hypothetical protein
MYEVIFIKYYAYRTAYARDIFMRLPRTMVAPLETELAKQAGKSATMKDNHTVYGFRTSRSGKPIYVMFSSGSAYFGNSVLEQVWP